MSFLSAIDPFEGDPGKETIFVQNEKFTNTFVTPYGERNFAENLLQSTRHNQIEKLRKLACSLNRQH